MIPAPQAARLIVTMPRHCRHGARLRRSEESSDRPQRASSTHWCRNARKTLSSRIAQCPASTARLTPTLQLPARLEEPANPVASNWRPQVVTHPAPTPLIAPSTPTKLLRRQQLLVPLSIGVSALALTPVPCTIVTAVFCPHHWSPPVSDCLARRNEFACTHRTIGLHRDGAHPAALFRSSDGL